MTRARGRNHVHPLADHGMTKLVARGFVRAVALEALLVACVPYWWTATANHAGEICVS